MEAVSRGVIIGFDKEITRDVRERNQDTIKILCELHEALTSEASSRMKCAVKIMAMPGARAAVFRMAGCDDGGPGFVNASVRTITHKPPEQKRNN